VVDQAEALGDGQALGRDVGADDWPGAERPPQHGGGQPDRAQAGDQQLVAAGDLEAQQGLVGGAEPAGHQRAVEVGEAVRQRQAGALLGQQEVGVPAVALPAVRGAVR
jgi:hypothetical protein